MRFRLVSGEAVGWNNGLSLPDTCMIDKDFANYFTSGTVLFYPDTLHMDPQSYAVMARFTAPSNGTVPSERVVPHPRQQRSCA